MTSFKARIYIIGINPYVIPPFAVLRKLFAEAGKDKGPIPVQGKLNGHPYIQTLVKYSGKWRLYLNTPMRQAADLEVGDKAVVEIEYDPAPRTMEMHPKLKAALKQNKQAKTVFDQLSPYRQKEIIRYINHLKTEATINKNVLRAINFLLSKEKFIGRDKPE
ncbi:MAG: YdeI/OmpD-associated family protein [Panacibacter sp.]